MLRYLSYTIAPNQLNVVKLMNTKYHCAIGREKDMGFVWDLYSRLGLQKKSLDYM